MKISKISIKNFRSIKEDDELEVGNFNVFVGQNNHGKTNLFEAVEWFFNGLRRGESIDDIRFGRSGSEEVSVEIEFTGALDGAKRMKNEKKRKNMLEALGSSDSVTIKRSGQERDRAVIIEGKKLDPVPTGFDNALNDFLPKFEYVDTKKYFEDVAKFSKTTPVGVMLSGVLTTILEKSEQYRKFRTQFEEIFGGEKSDIKVELDKLSSKVKIYLEKQFPDCTKVTFEVSPPIFEDLLKNFDTTVDDGIVTSASEKGDGMQRALMLAILQAYSDFRKKNDDIGKSFLFFIDEAELHLHPSAQRRLKNVLLELSAGEDQVFINTHSSVLVADEHDNQKIFKVEKLEKETNFALISELEKQYVVYDLLGGNPADLLLPKNFLVVEGRAELEFLMRVIAKHYSERPIVQLIPADGDLIQTSRSVNAIEQVFKPLDKSIYKDRVVICVDKQLNPDQVRQFQKNHPVLKSNNQFFEIPKKGLEEYYPSPWGSSRKMDGPAKVVLAKEVGDKIDKDKFEKEMSTMFKALERAWELAFN